MFDVVAADQDQPAPSVNGGCVDYSESRLAAARRSSKAVRSKATHQPRGETNESEYDQKGDKKSGSQRHLGAEQALKHQCAPFSR
jgi:hypothetical protein